MALACPAIRGKRFLSVNIATPVEGGAAAPAPPDDDGDRIAAILTRPDGRFKVTFEDGEFQIRNPQERRPDLLIKVLPPEEPGVIPEANPLYITKAVRQNAGRTEEYLIRLTTDELAKASISPPSLLPPDVETAKSAVGRLMEARVQTEALTEGTVAIARQRGDAHRTRYASFGTQFHPVLLDALSGVAANPVDPSRLVAAGESPFTKNSAIIQQTIRDTINSQDPAKRAPSVGYINLTDDQAHILKNQAAPDGSLDSDAVANVLGKKSPGPSTTLKRRLAALNICIPETAAQRCCSDALHQTGVDGHDPPELGPVVPAGDVTAITAQDIPRLLARLVDPMTAPEEEVLTGLMPAATRDSVQASIRTLDFQPSPADVPAFHDFSNLQIAFQHVWQEAIDQGALRLAQDAYETIVELGGDPTRPEYQGLHPLVALQAESRLIRRAVRSAAAPVMRDHRGGDTDPSTASGGVVVTGPVRDRRGEDPAIDSSNPAVRLPALLTALEQRLKKKYAFTVFAANGKERSVNFGILNTYWQEWIPLSYQAGPLVKSIPLAPKQSQKVVITRKVTKRRATKEAESNLKVLREETSQTNRAEQEIANRASSKTEFGFSSEFSAGIGPESTKTTTNFKQDAAKSSDNIKKSFHEAVFKAAQEFKNERTTEVATEETESFEYNETTEISNPNDEIAVTFLFYELQRRFQLHEMLYRVRPVVLVAQEFPNPGDIDQAWLVASDWILKRVILDDSFLPTLNTRRHRDRHRRDGDQHRPAASDRLLPPTGARRRPPERSDAAQSHRFHGRECSIGERCRPTPGNGG
jgi:hypothetical protein